MKIDVFTDEELIFILQMLLLVKEVHKDFLKSNTTINRSKKEEYENTINNCKYLIEKIVSFIKPTDELVKS